MRHITSILSLSLCSLGCAIALTACLESSDDTVEHLESTAGSELEFRAYSEDPLIRGKEITDDIVTLVQGSSEFELERFWGEFQLLIPHMPFGELTVAEEAELNDYIDARFATIADELTQLGMNDFPEAQPVSLTNPNVCYTRCAFLFEFACENSESVGLCFGFWGCDAEFGAHQCFDIEPPPGGGGGGGGGGAGEPCGDDLCFDPWACATWAFKPNECVLTCNSNSDCPGSQKCKQPFGTTFKRCV